MTHKDFDGVIMIMEMITGNGNRYPLAAALCDVENHENYVRFFQMICSYKEEAPGIGPMWSLLNNQKSVIMSDHANKWNFIYKCIQFLK